MTTRLPAEWEQQDAVLLAWPHPGSDWAPRLAAVRRVFRELLRAILRHEKAVVVAPDPEEVRRELAAAGLSEDRLLLCEVPTDDTWARDFGPITVFHEGEPLLLDFEFNGWGGKFSAENDNRITEKLRRQGLFGRHPAMRPGLVLEGGSLDSDGRGTLLTTARCLLNPNRNPHLGPAELEARLSELLGVRRFFWLRHGFLAGDDTDAHVDILARFCSPEVIAFSSCDDERDEHCEELRRMETELAAFRTPAGRPYRLIPLPIPAPIHDENGRRLAASYANFLIVNGAVLVPVYQDPRDEIALTRLGEVFPERELIGIDCREPILQGGSLHCLTMQLPKGVLA
ncbi:MAG: agmatine deiminase family protein [Deltaproteobacteria bacterium]|nr:agmatine deiminase family protein [Deltaproteobacteria bacterium]